MGSLKSDHVQEIRRTLTDPIQLVRALQLTKGAKKTTKGATVRCPVHSEKSASCSVHRGKDGTIAVYCFGCGFGGDALSLIAAVHGLDVRANFKDVLLEAATLAGLHTVIDEINGRAKYTPRELPPLLDPEPDVEYPDKGEIDKFWSDLIAIKDDPVTQKHLASRGLDYRDIDVIDLARVIEPGWPCPRWAATRFNSWVDSGHRLIVPMYDSSGVMRTVRSWRVEGDSPAKRLPPNGCKAQEVVMANRMAKAILGGNQVPCRVLLVEGEPDYLSAATRWPGYPVIGIINGSWTDGFAERIAYGSEMVIMTHHDEAGDRYAAQITESLKDKAQILRSSI